MHSLENFFNPADHAKDFPTRGYIKIRCCIIFDEYIKYIYFGVTEPRSESCGLGAQKMAQKGAVLKLRIYMPSRHARAA